MEIFDGEQLTPFAFSSEEIVTYDNTVSISAKVLGFGGWLDVLVC